MTFKNIYLTYSDFTLNSHLHTNVNIKRRNKQTNENKDKQTNKKLTPTKQKGNDPELPTDMKLQ